jgi:hypothetical protein
MHRQCKIIYTVNQYQLYFSPRHSTTPHLFNMTWQNDDFLLADCVKLFYTVSVSPLISSLN